MMEEATTIMAERDATADEKPSLVGFWYPSLIAIFILQTVIIVSGNSLTAYAYWTSASLQKSLHNLLICNLSLADLSVAIIGQPFYFMRYTETGVRYASTHKYKCLLGTLSINTSINMSLLAIAILCLERYVAVIHPYKYYNLVTLKSVRVAIASSYILAFVPTTLPLLGWNEFEEGIVCRGVYVHPKGFATFIGTFRAVIIAATVLMNACIANVAYTKGRTSVANVNAEGQPDGVLTGGYKVTKMLLAVFGVYYACWIPFIIMTSMYKRNTDRSTAFLICHDYTKVLVGVNSCINPLIYLKSNTEFREAFKKAARRIFLRQRD